MTPKRFYFKNDCHQKSLCLDFFFWNVAIALFWSLLQLRLSSEFGITKQQDHNRPKVGCKNTTKKNSTTRCCAKSKQSMSMNAINSSRTEALNYACYLVCDSYTFQTILTPLSAQAFKHTTRNRNNNSTTCGGMPHIQYVRFRFFCSRFCCCYCCTYIELAMLRKRWWKRKSDWKVTRCR